MTDKKWKGEYWWVSPYNFEEKIRKTMHLPEKVEFHDCTLREGEQQSGITFRKKEKIEIARKLNECGVQRIEAGMPAVSKEDAEAIKAIAKEGLDAKIYAFSRCMVKDIDLAIGCDVDGVVIEIPSNPHMVERAYGWPYEKAIKLSIESTKYAHDHGLSVTFFTIDGTRADPSKFIELIKRVSTEGYMDSLAIVDTFGVCIPEAIKYFIGLVKKEVDKPLEIHAHNDFGLATANSLAALAEGVGTVHTTVTGSGERCGNAPLEEVVPAIKCLYGIETLDCGKLYGLSKLVQKYSGISAQQFRPVVGDAIFHTETGIAADWYLRVKDTEPTICFPLLPEFVGQDKPKLVLGKMSGKANIKYKAEQLGIDLSDDDVSALVQKVKEESIKKKGTLTDNEFKSLVKKVKKA